MYKHCYFGGTAFIITVIKNNKSPVIKTRIKYNLLK